MMTDLAIRKKSIAIGPSADAPEGEKTYLKFTLDAQKPCEIRIYLRVKEIEQFFYNVTNNLVEELQ